MPLAPQLIGQITVAIESPDSGKIVLDTKITKTKSYRGPATVLSLGIVPRGTLGTGEMLGWVVSRCEFSPEKGHMAELVMTWEAGDGSGEPLPPDEVSLEPFEVNPKLERNAYFASLTPDEVATVKSAAQSFDDQKNNTNRAIVETYASPSHQVLMAAMLEKIVKYGIETFYVAGFKYSWARSYYGLPSLTVGGYTQSPQGPLADNLPTGLSWLRQADSVQNSGVKGSIYKVTRTWLGGPIIAGTGYWDPDLYGS